MIYQEEKEPKTIKENNKDMKNNYTKEFSNYLQIMSEALNKNDFAVYDAAKEMLEETVEDCKHEKALADQLNTNNFGILNHIFEERLPELFKTNKKAVRNVIKTIREDNNLMGEFNYYNTIRQYKGKVAETVSSDMIMSKLNEAIVATINKSTVIESNKKLRKVLKENNIIPNDFIDDEMKALYESGHNILTKKNGSMNNVMVILKAMLADAVLEGVIEKSPMKFFDQIKLTTRATDTYHRALTEKEQASFFRTAKKESHFFGVYAMMICTGMRSGEVCALRWEDVDLQKRIIHVRRTVTYNADATITEGSPKTYAGIRDVPITDKCLDILESQRRWLHKIGFPEDEIVFPSPEGKYIRNGSLNDEIIRIRRLLSEKGIRIEHFTTHALRDTFATRYIEQGGSPQSLKEIMGHASIATTMDLYAQVLPETKKKETSRIKISV